MGGDRRLGLIAVAAVVLLVPMATGQPANLWGDQDDAGSGGDAPDRFEDGLAIEPGSYEGTLFEVADDRIAKPFLDEADWYRFWVEEGQRIELDAEASDVPRGATIFELRRARDAGIGNYTISSGGEASTSLVTDRSGWWALRVGTSADGESTYEFTLAIEERRPGALARAEPGWVSTGVEVQPGGEAMMYVWQPHRTFPENNEFMSVLVEDGHEFVAGLTGTSNPHRLGAEAGPLEIHITTRAGPGWMSARALKAVIEEPGTYHLVHMADADDLYMSAWVEEAENATALGSAHGGDLVKADASDFEGTAAVDASWAHASLDVTKTVDVDHTLVGFYDCGEALTHASRCVIESPSGDKRAFGANYTLDFFVEPESGVWTFERERSLDLHPDRRLFVADVDLPGLGP